MKKVLSLCGGGIRGILSLEILKAIEKKEGKKACEIFDLIIGTSTGSIIAAGLSSGISAELISRDFLLLYEKVFKRSLIQKLINPFGLMNPKYDSNTIIEQIQSRYDVQLDSLKTLYMSTAYSVKDCHVKIFKSWREEDQKEYKLYDTVLASIAAPTYFAEYKGFIDGGVYSNNPSLIAVLESLKLWKGEFIDVTSIGTGYISNSLETSKWGALEWIVKKGKNPIVDIFTDSNMDLVQYTCKNLSKDSFNYNHYDINLSDFIRDAPMDSKNKKYIQLLINLGQTIHT